MTYSATEMKNTISMRFKNATCGVQTLKVAESGFNPLRQTHMLTSNFAIGGRRGGNLSQTSFPARDRIDDARVYQSVPSASR